MMDTKTTEKRITELCRIYTSKPQIGLVAGAGVSKNSCVPTYRKMALDLYKRASEQNLLPNAPAGAVAFLEEQAELLERGEKEKLASLKPKEIVLFVKTYLADEKDKKDQVWLKLVKEILYDKVDTTKTHKMVVPKTYRNNNTLHSVICFCAALPGSVLAPKSTPPTKSSKSKKRSQKKKRKKGHRIETNTKVGGILTTNYDYLIEGSFGSKFGRRMLKPVGRPASRESLSDRRVIPVYHVHGYVSYVPPKEDPEGVKGSELVIAEDDYFKIFYDPLGFGNYIAMSFFRRLPCLFIGSSMIDENIRRFLYHLRKDKKKMEEERKTSTKINHFAILKKEGTLQDDFKDAVLSSYGVSTIWVDEYEEIGEILKRVYTSVEGVEPEHWENLKEFKWWADR